MTKNLLNNKPFLELFLNTSRQQAVELLKTVTDEQLLLLSEIAKNLFKLPLPNTAAKRNVEHRKVLFQQLANKRVSKRKKRQAIIRHRMHILKTLYSLKPELLNMIQ